ncbi:MAG: hypothetical protein WCT01_03775, partial [Candidatus Shapirobacteria bacterium]
QPGLTTIGRLTCGNEFLRKPGLVFATGIPEGPGKLSDKYTLSIGSNEAQFALGWPFLSIMNNRTNEFNDLLSGLESSGKKIDLVLYSMGAQMLGALKDHARALKSLTIVNPGMGKGGFANNGIAKAFGGAASWVFNLTSVENFREQADVVLDQLNRADVPVNVFIAQQDELLNHKLAMEVFGEREGVTVIPFEGGHEITEATLREKIEETRTSTVI